jgi:L-alanine-DL-glutamate epimerase-like enolase superfamily enzyme
MSHPLRLSHLRHRLCAPSLREQLTTPFPGIANGAMELPSGPGLGVVPDGAALRDWETLCLTA